MYMPLKLIYSLTPTIMIEIIWWLKQDELRTCENAWIGCKYELQFLFYKIHGCPLREICKGAAGYSLKSSLLSQSRINCLLPYFCGWMQSFLILGSFNTCTVNLCMFWLLYCNVFAAVFQTVAVRSSV